MCITAAVFALSVGFAYWSGENTARVPILMYHNLADEGEPGSTISAEAFEGQMRALRDAGYTAITFSDLEAYVSSGAPLPEKTVIITFDDGYQSVYDVAFPILKKYSMKATVSVIGVFYGESTYKGKYFLPITPHFGDKESMEMVESGIISIQSHSYDMHHYIPYEPDEPRVGILRRSGESREEYIAAFKEDFGLAADQIENAVGIRPFVYSYPFGRATMLSERLLREMGVKVTLTTSARINTVVKGVPSSLFRLGRLNVPGDMSPAELLDLIAV